MLPQRSGAVGALTLTCLLLVLHATSHGVWAIAEAPPLPPVTALYQRRTQWQDHSLLLSALQASRPASAAVLVTDAAPKAPKVLLLGDQGGAVHLLATDGTLLGSQDTGSGTAVTALASYRLARNATVVLTGHESGEVRVLLLRLPTQDSLDAAAEGSAAPPLAELQLLTVLLAEQLLCGTPETWAGLDPGGGGAASASASGGPCAPITQLSSVSGRSGSGSGLVTAVSAGGVAVLRLEGRDRPGDVRVALRLPLGAHAVVAARTQHALLTLLGQDGVAALPAGPASVVGSAPITHSASQLLWSPCAGLNGTRILAGVFQEPQGHNALAATADGRLAVLAVGGNGGRKGCQLKSSTRLPSQLAAAISAGGAPPAALTWQKGYLLLSTPRQLAVFNMSDGWSRKPPRLVLSQELADLAGGFMPGGASSGMATARGVSQGVGGHNAGSTAGGSVVAAAEAALAAGLTEAAMGTQAAGLEHSSGAAGGHVQQIAGGTSGQEACQLGAGASQACSAASSADPTAGAAACQAASTLASSGGSTGGSSASSSTTSSASSTADGQGRAGVSEGEPGCSPGSPPLELMPVQQVPPLLVADSGGLVAVGFGSGLVAVYESRLPQRPRPPPPSGAAFLQFLQPLAILGVAGFVVWRARNRREGMATGIGQGANMGEFERLLRGATARVGRQGRPGVREPLLDFDEELSDSEPIVDPSHPAMARMGPSFGRSDLPGRQAQQQQHPLGSSGQRGVPAGSGDWARGAERAGGAAGTGSGRGGSSAGEAVWLRGQPLGAGPAQGLSDSGDEEDEGYLGEQEAARAPHLAPQMQFDYAPIQPLRAGGQQAGSRGVRAPLLPSDGVTYEQGGDESEEDDDDQFDGDDFEVYDQAGAEGLGVPLLGRRGVGSAARADGGGGAAGGDGGRAAALDELRRQYGILDGL